MHASPIEVSVVYYRAGYTPNDYPTSAHYALRETLSRSRSINCPTLALQLAGGKKVQQALTKPGVLERFLLPSSHGASISKAAFGPEMFTEQVVADIRGTWVAMWGLDDAAASSDAAGPGGATAAAEGNLDGVAWARASASRLVLKPQREGGGNNVYKDAIPAFLDTLPEAERAAWVAMALIEPPMGTTGYLVRAGGADVGAKRAEVVSELGVFGWALFQEGQNDEVNVQQQGQGGWLVRTKGRESVSFG